MFPSSATGLLMSPRSHEIRTHNCVDVPNVCRRPRIDIDRICSDEIYNLLRAFYVYVCVCVHPRFAWKKRNWQMRMSTRNVTSEVLSVRQPRIRRVRDWFNWLARRWLVFFGKEAWYFIYIGNVWKLFVDIKQKNYYFDWNIYLH